MTYAIRQYEEQDLEAVLSAWENAARLAHPFLSEAFFDQERDNLPQIYLPNADTWVAVTDGQVVGFLALIGNEVGGLFVEPEFHGTGAGKVLMDKAQQLHGDLEVEVFEANSIGRKFYASYGFEALSESIHEATGNNVLRLRFTA